MEMDKYDYMHVQLCCYGDIGQKGQEYHDCFVIWQDTINIFDEHF